MTARSKMESGVAITLTLCDFIEDFVPPPLRSHSFGNMVRMWEGLGYGRASTRRRTARIAGILRRARRHGNRVPQSRCLVRIRACARVLGMLSAPPPPPPPRGASSQANNPYGYPGSGPAPGNAGIPGWFWVALVVTLVIGIGGGVAIGFPLFGSSNNVGTVDYDQRVLCDRVEKLAPVDVEDYEDLLEAVSYFARSEEHTSELQSRFEIVCRLLLEDRRTRHVREMH